MRSSELGIREFKSTSGWLDIRDIVSDRIESIRNLLETTVDIDDIKFQQGRIQELRLFLDFPDIIEEELKDKKEKRK